MDEPSIGLTPQEMSIPEIRPEDMKFLMFLYTADAISRQSQYDWQDRLYWDWVKWKALLYGIIYPIMFIWDSLRKIRSKLKWFLSKETN